MSVWIVISVPHFIRQLVQLLGAAPFVSKSCDLGENLVTQTAFFRIYSLHFMPSFCMGSPMSACLYQMVNHITTAGAV
jgi:hypothetical protein